MPARIVNVRGARYSHLPLIPTPPNALLAAPPRAAESTLLCMCRNIRPLHNFAPPATHDEVHDAALQYVRKISGTTKPSQANAEAFSRAVGALAPATAHLLDELTSKAPPKDREVEAAKRRARAATRVPARA